MKQGKIVLSGYFYKENEKIPKVYNQYQQEIIQKEFAYDLLKNVGINSFTLQI